jgi:hypothetical protein
LIRPDIADPASIGHWSSAACLIACISRAEQAFRRFDEVIERQGRAGFQQKADADTRKDPLRNSRRTAPRLPDRIHQRSGRQDL